VLPPAYGPAPNSCPGVWPCRRTPRAPHARGSLRPTYARSVYEAPTSTQCLWSILLTIPAAVQVLQVCDTRRRREGGATHSTRWEQRTSRAGSVELARTSEAPGTDAVWGPGCAPMRGQSTTSTRFVLGTSNCIENYIKSKMLWPAPSIFLAGSGSLILYNFTIQKQGAQWKG
jgi:hypothetical protein